MYFFSSSFLKFFVIFFVIHLIFRYFLKGKFRNILVVGASYYFYGRWDWRFLSLVWISTLLDYFIGKWLDRETDPRKRKQFLILSIAVNLGILGFFKYYDFFISNFALLLEGFGFHPSITLLELILPPGISFYTFQTMSYSIDIYRRKIKHEDNLVDFACYVAFFPQLIAGPIERAGDLLPQFKKSDSVALTLTGFALGVRLFCWGLFKKLFVADNLAMIADTVFDDPGKFDSLSLLVAVYAFSFQIYCDFSGYSDMARGLGKMMGIELSINFNLPHFSTSVRDFWRRWHITLSTWLRDYIYIPLGGSRKGLSRTIYNLILTMFLCGLWHGAGWNFILWGVYNGVLMSMERLFENHSFTRAWRSWPTIIRVATTFHLVIFGWIIFRAQNMEILGVYLSRLFDLNVILETAHNFTPNLINDGFRFSLAFCFYLFPLLIIQYLQYRKNDHTVDLHWPSWVQGLAYGFLAFLFWLLSIEDGKQFIYFQF